MWDMRVMLFEHTKVRWPDEALQADYVDGNGNESIPSSRCSRAGHCCCGPHT